MSDLVLTVELYKKGFLKDHQVAREQVGPYIHIIPNEVIRNENTYFRCINNKKTTFYGVAYAVATINRKVVKTLHAYSEKNITLDCGD